MPDDTDPAARFRAEAAAALQAHGAKAYQQSIDLALQGRTNDAMLRDAIATTYQYAADIVREMPAPVADEVRRARPARKRWWVSPALFTAFIVGIVSVGAAAVIIGDPAFMRAVVAGLGCAVAVLIVWAIVLNWQVAARGAHDA